jgi:hypothetical protein
MRRNADRFQHGEVGGLASARSRWLTVVVFAIAMAWVESAAVYYLRTHIGRVEPLQANPLPLVGTFGPVELVRELATMIMLLTVGLLAGRTWRARFGYTFIAFGLWDIFYYVFLKAISGWPHSLLDSDILFLLPVPWWGPVLAPMLIASLMIAWGTLASQAESEPHRRVSNGRVWLLCFLGTVLALWVFMADALRVLNRGIAATRDVLPADFHWTLFLIAVALMAAPVAQELWLLRLGGDATIPAGHADAPRDGRDDSKRGRPTN